MKGNIPSPRQLKLKRFERADFRASTRRGKHGAGWTWSRAMHALRRWHQQLNAALDRDIVEPFRELARAIAAFKARHPVWQPKRRPELKSERLIAVEAGWYVLSGGASFRREPSSMAIASASVSRESAPPRLSARRTGAAHRLENLKTLPSQAYMGALDARNKYVIANLIRLQAFASQRAAGESTWMEARRADHYATA